MHCHVWNPIFRSLSRGLCGRLMLTVTQKEAREELCVFLSFVSIVCHPLSYFTPPSLFRHLKPRHQSRPLLSRNQGRQLKPPASLVTTVCFAWHSPVSLTPSCVIYTVALCPAVWPSLRRCPSCGVPARRCYSADCSKTSAQDRSNTGALQSSLTYTSPCPEWHPLRTDQMQK